MRLISWAFVALVIIAALTAHAAADTITKSITAIPKDSITLAADTTNEKIAYREVTTSILPDEKNEDLQLWLFDAVKQLAHMISCTNEGKAGDAFSDSASVADNGLVVFHTWAGNLVPVPNCANVLIKDVEKGDIRLVKDHALSPAISADGKYIAYEYNADPEHGLPAIYRYDVERGTELFIDYTSLGNTKGGWYFPNPKISGDGLTITYHTTKNGKPEIWQWTQEKKPVKIQDGVVA